MCFCVQCVCVQLKATLAVVRCTGRESCITAKPGPRNVHPVLLATIYYVTLHLPHTTGTEHKVHWFKVTDKEKLSNHYTELMTLDKGFPLLIKNSHWARATKRWTDQRERHQAHMPHKAEAFPKSTKANRLPNHCNLWMNNNTWYNKEKPYWAFSYPGGSYASKK